MGKQWGLVLETGKKIFEYIYMIVLFHYRGYSVGVDIVPGGGAEVAEAV